MHLILITMKILLNDVNPSVRLDEHLSLYGINFSRVNTWDSSIDQFGRHCIPADLLNEQEYLLIMDPPSFQACISYETGFNSVRTFLNNNNKIWLWNDIDAFTLIELASGPVRENFLEINKFIPNGSLSVFLDAPISDRHWLNQCTNIEYHCTPLSYFWKAVDVVDSSIRKNSVCKDFLFFVILKKIAPHRKILMNRIINEPKLTDNSLIICKTLQNKIPLASFEFPVTELYQNAWVEVIPETLYQYGYYVTEKTVKAILMETPFLILAAPGYLQYLRSLGFKTFNHLINEEYDQQFRCVDRANAIVTQLVDIVSNGAESFYRECQSVISHNKQRLYELKGQWFASSDNFIQQHLCKVGAVNINQYRFGPTLEKFVSSNR